MSKAFVWGKKFTILITLSTMVLIGRSQTYNKSSSTLSLEKEENVSAVILMTIFF